MKTEYFTQQNTDYSYTDQELEEMNARLASEMEGWAEDDLNYCNQVKNVSDRILNSMYEITGR
jgi:hypothetical protein